MKGLLARPVRVSPGQPEHLGDATVVVVGVGGLGSEVSKLLAQSGVGRLVLCDPDAVETSNLNRGALYSHEDVGTPKVTAAAAALRALAPGIDVRERADDFRHGLGLAELRDADLVVSCLDSIADRIALCGRCTFAGATRGLLDAGVHPWGGEVRHYTAEGACYACRCSPADRSMPAWHEACGLADEAGASAPIVALVAAWQALYAVALLCDDERLPATIVKIDPRGGSNRPVSQERNTECPCHEVIDGRQVESSPLTVRATVEELLAWVHPGEHVLAWNPVDRRDPLSSLSLGAAHPSATLQDLGIPPGEILPVIRVRPERHVRYLALRGA